MTNCNKVDIAALESEITDENGSCPAIGYQKVDVCVPVVVTPFAKSGRTITTCCGDPVVASGNTPCAGIKNGTCSFTIKQTICVEVPVEFGANASVGDTFVNCLGSSAENICTNCRKEED